MHLQINKFQIMLFKYIFFRICIFYIKVFKETKIPHWFSALIIAIILMANIQVIIDSYTYFYDKETIGLFTAYNEYIVLLIGFSIILYTSKQKRYIQIIEACNNLSKKRKRTLDIVSSIYLLTLFVLFFWLGSLIRQYNNSYTIIYP